MAVQCDHLQDLAFKPFDFNALLKLEVEAHMEAVQAVSLRASKEASLAKALAKMRADWDGVLFNVIPYKDSGTFILGGVDDVQVRPPPPPPPSPSRADQMHEWGCCSIERMSSFG